MSILEISFSAAEKTLLRSFCREHAGQSGRGKTTSCCVESSCALSVRVCLPNDDIGQRAIHVPRDDPPPPKVFRVGHTEQTGVAGRVVEHGAP